MDCATKSSTLSKHKCQVNIGTRDLFWSRDQRERELTRATRASMINPTGVYKNLERKQKAKLILSQVELSDLK